MAPRRRVAGCNATLPRTHVHVSERPLEMRETFPSAKIRDAFPALSIQDRGVPRLYLDNPAGTQVPRAVADAISRCAIETNANLGGYFTTSVAAGEIMANARGAMADFLGAGSPDEIVVGSSMTALTFALSRSLARGISAGEEIVVTRMDHDGNIAPWLEIARERGASIRWIPFDRESWSIQPSALAQCLSEKTRVVAFTYASNLTGSVNDVRRLCQLARQSGALTYVDAVQYAPHRAIDVEALGCDFLACSAYKFFGPHLGVVWARKELLANLYAYKVRPQPAEVPAKFELGTPQIELHAGLLAAVAYLAWLGSLVGADGTRRARIRDAFAAIADWELQLVRRLIEGLVRLGGVTICGISNSADFDRRVPTVSFRHERIASSTIARELARRNIFVWSGHNFALETVRSLGMSEDEGVVRIGLVHYNTAADVDAVLEALGTIFSLATA